MNFIDKYYLPLHQLLGKINHFDAIAPLLLRIYLAPIFLQAGYNKITNLAGVAGWFEAMGFPAPYLLAALAAGTELIGGALLLIGLATRWISIPLIITMLVAIFTVHWENGWLAIADGGSWLANDRVIAAQEQLSRARGILQEYGNYDWLTSNGSVVILNNGIEFAATYLVMLLVLLFNGGGRYISVDYWLAKRLLPNT